MSVYAMCQEGMTLVKAIDVELNKGKPCYLSPSNPMNFFHLESMICHPPKSAITTTVEQAKLKFRLESTGIVVLLILLGFNFVLYLLILPCMVWYYVIVVANPIYDLF